MELSAVFLLLLVLAVVVVFVARPFTEHRRAQAEGGREISSLLAERDRVLSALQDLDFDHSLGKIPVEEYPVQRVMLLQKGVDVLRRLDEIQGVQSAPVEARVEAGVAAHHTETVPPPARSFSDDELEDLIAKRRAVHKEKTAGFCPKCGKPVLQSDQFCSSCGQTVNKA